MTRKNREVSANKKVFRIHLRKDVHEILLRKQQELSRFCVILNDHLTLVIQIAFKNVRVVPLVYFACLSVGRERNGRRFVVRSALVAPGAGVASFGVCHFFKL